MPAILDDPTSPTLYRVSGAPPYPDPEHPALPEDIVPRQVTLRDRQTVATIVPFASPDDVPLSLTRYLCDQLNKEIDGGDTYPMMDPFPTEDFARYWFSNFGAVMLLGSINSAAEVTEGDGDDADSDWSQRCLGSFYIKPNYTGRSSHICNGGFLVTDASRNRGVGRLMGEAYIDWAPRLGYSYSVFNLVYETNVASCRIWDALGFKRIGRVKGCGNLRSYPDRLIDAIIYGRDLVVGGGAGGDGEDLVSEERFDKIKFYLKYGKYPNGADRAEKSRLRSAATHYKLLEGDKLMLKDKEVIADPARQYEIARAVHVSQHGGINKTTATIAEKYHWSRIKETVSDVIRNCGECKELGKTPNPGGASRKGAAASVGAGASLTAAVPGASSSSSSPTVDDLGANTGTTPLRDGSVPRDILPDDGTGGVLALQSHPMMPTFSQTSTSPSPGAYANPSDISVLPPSHTLSSSTQSDHHHHHVLHSHAQDYMLQDHPHHLHAHHHHHHHHHADDDDGGAAVYQPIDPQIINQPHDNPFDHYHAHADDFQALLSATDEVVVGVPGAQPETDAAAAAAAAAAVDRDLEMLIEHQDDDDEDDDDGGADADTTMVDGVRNGVDDQHGTVRDAGGQRSRDMYGATFGGQGA